MARPKATGRYETRAELEEAVRAMANNGMKYEHIRKRVGVSWTTVHQIMKAGKPTAKPLDWRQPT